MAGPKKNPAPKAQAQRPQDPQEELPADSVADIPGFSNIGELADKVDSDAEEIFVSESKAIKDPLIKIPSKLRKFA